MNLDELLDKMRYHDRPHPFYAVTIGTKTFIDKDTDGVVKKVKEAGLLDKDKILIKLSKVQREVLELMDHGWELGRSTSDFCGGCSVQKGGLGRGGESKKVNSNTWHALWKKKLIRCVDSSYPTEKYALTVFGRKVLEEAQDN